VEESQKEVSTLFEKNEFLGKLINCSMCTGFWVGLYFSIVMFLYLVAPMFGISESILTGIFYILTLPFATSGVSWILERLASIIDIKAHTLIEESEKEESPSIEINQNHI
jgi:uncharacterized membrane protein